MIRLIDMSNENEIFKLTGCLSSCNKDEVDVVEASELITKNIENTLGDDEIVGKKQALKLYLYFKNGQYDEREQYIIYDYNSFIADVGGYMGLLLGMSMQGMFEIVEDWLVRLRG